MNVVKVLQQVVDKEEDVYIVDVFRGLCQIICFVRLSLERRIVLAEMPGA